MDTEIIFGLIEKLIFN